MLGAWSCEAISCSLQDASMHGRYEQWLVHNSRVYNDINENLKYLTNEEFKATRNRFKGHECSTKTTSFKDENVTEVPATVDWRKQGAVTPMKDQGQCGN
ncbi:hypothetical protein L3X38_017413 [Prunus dulcis]|uniref:Peptidase C1A papain C-terminal domain-containing protein n=1 Tax=Prunus dulcis TaxID=3755 RepID=A0AAD4W932_PRUDU|nr:hypothetical protein L3X38_017413 [Prunus dulcis]